MENTTNFTLQTPSLRHLVLQRIDVHILWNHCDIISDISELKNGRKELEYHFSAALKVCPLTGLSTGNEAETSKKWAKIESKAKDKIATLPLPASCKKSLINFLKPLGFEMMDWCWQYLSVFPNHLNFIEQPRWTMLGTIDYKKTAQFEVKNEHLAIERRYLLACLNCLEDDIRSLIQRIPENLKNKLLYCLKDLEIIYKMDLAVYWTCVISGHIHQLDGYIRTTGYSLNQYLLRGAIFSGNLIASEYFFERLNQKERERAIVECGLLVAGTFKWSPSYKLLFLWSRMNEDQVEELFRKKLHDVLQCFLRWPMQPLFVETAKRGWRHLDARHYKDVLVLISDYIRNECEDYDYFQLFREFWQLCPLDYKVFFINDCIVLDLPYSTNEDVFKAMADDGRHVGILPRKYNEKMTEIVMDERLISDETLMECKIRLELDWAKAGGTDEKRTLYKYNMQYHMRLVGALLETRNERRRLLRDNRSVPVKEMFEIQK